MEIYLAMNDMKQLDLFTYGLPSSENPEHKNHTEVCWRFICRKCYTCPICAEKVFAPDQVNCAKEHGCGTCETCLTWQDEKYFTGCDYIAVNKE